MASTPLVTFQDSCEHLWSVFNPATKAPTGRELRLAKAAVINSYRKMVNDYHWTYYKRRLQIATEANYSTGTVVFDLTGGASERLVTLTGGTFPTNAARGTIKISGAHYPVETRESGTTLTLGVNGKPAADVASTTYEWYRDAYPLPVNFRRMDQLMDVANLYPLAYVSPEEWLQYTRHFSGQTISRPEWYTIKNAGDYIGSLSIVFGRAPNTARAYDVIYEAVPRELKTYLSNAGTFSCTATSTTVTGVGTAFNTKMIGSIFRASDTSTAPTGVMGTVDGTLNPYDSQRIITAVSGTTGLTLDGALSSTVSYSGDAYAVSDPIDIEVNTMLSYFQRLTEAEYSKLAKRDDWQEHAAMAKEELMFAMSNDVRSTTIESGMLVEEGHYHSSWGDVTTGGAGE